MQSVIRGRTKSKVHQYSRGKVFTQKRFHTDGDQLGRLRSSAEFDA